MDKLPEISRNYSILTGQLDYFEKKLQNKYPAFNDEVQKGKGLNPSPIATKTCIVCLPQPITQEYRYEEKYHRIKQNV